jgi:hypothetical protein
METRTVMKLIKNLRFIVVSCTVLIPREASMKVDFCVKGESVLPTKRQQEDGRVETGDEAS